MHLDLFHSRTFASFAAATFDIEGKASWLIALHLGGWKLGKEIADGIKELDIGARIGSGCPTDGLLVYGDNLVYMVCSGYRSELSYFVVCAIEHVVQMRMESLVD